MPCGFDSNDRTSSVHDRLLHVPIVRMSLRRVDGFKRYALAVQYHGSSFLGFSYLGKYEDCILADGTDLRGYRSVEGRIRQALDGLFGEHAWENFQVSSRTDRGVHALKNTFHVDIHGDTEQTYQDVLKKLQKGLNHHLIRQTTSWSQQQRNRMTSKKRNHGFAFTIFEEDDWRRHSVSDELRILSAQLAPDWMENPFAQNDPSQPTQVDWNSRFSATQRTYIYRILSFDGMDGEWGVPFEWDRSWRIRSKGASLDVDAMQQAAYFLQGTHDFSSFRGGDCQRMTPVVHMESISVNSIPYGPPALLGMDETSLQFLGQGGGVSIPQLITVSIVGTSFLYRQVRNMVACLVDVGRGKLKPADVERILQAKDRRQAPGMAPPQGLFLVDVQHGDFQI